MWDYNVGLVRVTPFFKCCKYSKVAISFLTKSMDPTADSVPSDNACEDAP